VGEGTKGTQDDADRRLPERTHDVAQVLFLGSLLVFALLSGPAHGFSLEARQIVTQQKRSPRLQTPPGRGIRRAARFITLG
jgi:hypothetical protein